MTRNNADANKATRRQSDEPTPPRRPSVLDPAPCPLATRRGSAVYPLVLSLAMIVVVTGLTLLAVRRADHRVHANVERSVQAQYVALAGIEVALQYLEAHSTWRQTLPNGTWYLTQPFGRGTYTVTGTDPDGTLADNEADPVTLLSTGNVDGAISKVHVTLKPRLHPVMQCACFASGIIDIHDPSTINGKARSNNDIDGESGVTIGDDAFFETVTGHTICQSLRPQGLVSAAMSYPLPSQAYYLSLATAITGTGHSPIVLERASLVPTTTNPNGIYALNANGGTVAIRKCYVKGTLIIYNASNTVTFQTACHFEPLSSPAPYPTLLIFGGGNVDFSLDQTTLSEAADYVDYDGSGAVDPSKTFPSGFSGVVWTQNSYLNIHRAGSTFKGCVIGARIDVSDHATINYDTTLAQAPIPGFILPDMQVAPGTWEEVQ